MIYVKVYRYLLMLEKPRRKILAVLYLLHLNLFLKYCLSHQENMITFVVHLWASSKVCNLGPIQINL